MKFRPGDRIGVIDEDLEGRVIAVNDGEVKIETTEGFILNFREEEVVLIENIENIIPEGAEGISEVIHQKQQEASRKRPREKVRRKDRQAPPLEVDLHIHKLVSSSARMDNFQILNLQLDTARRQLEFAISKRIQRVVFIHGVGEGVLKAELETLFSRYENIKFYDADFQKYGMGATETYILQNY